MLGPRIGRFKKEGKVREAAKKIKSFFLVAWPHVASPPPPSLELIVATFLGVFYCFIPR